VNLSLPSLSWHPRGVIPDRRRPPGDHKKLGVWQANIISPIPASRLIFVTPLSLEWIAGPA
jgi:hypothetical protein